MIRVVYMENISGCPFLAGYDMVAHSRLSCGLDAREDALVELMLRIQDPCVASCSSLHLLANRLLIPLVPLRSVPGSYGRH